jgi:hypothetical protein
VDRSRATDAHAWGGGRWGRHDVFAAGCWDSSGERSDKGEPNGVEKSHIAKLEPAKIRLARHIAGGNKGAGATERMWHGMGGVIGENKAGLGNGPES